MEKDIYVIVQCPFGCGARLRFPRVQCSLRVTCPRCQKAFTWTPFGIVWDDRFHAASVYRLPLLARLVRQKRKWVGIALFLLLCLTSLSVLTQNTRQEVPISEPQPSNENVTSPQIVLKPDVSKSVSSSTNTPVANVGAIPDKQVSHMQGRNEGGLPLAKLFPPDAVQEQRPLNGAYLEPPRLTQGHSSLVVENGTAWDAVVKLVKQEVGSRITARFVYVRHGESVLLTDIEPGDYILAWCCGADWDAVVMQFSQLVGCFADDKTFTFSETITTSREGTSIEFTEARVTLHEVINGNLRKRSISQEEFQGL